ncbi:2-C-methyl-D-erythritol 2,4-cyclodiphosphate synthase, partial [Acidobacteriota bacterium]
MKIRIGIGYDLHPLESGRPLYLGGLEIPFSKGLVGHSDGDCLIHAVIDAVLGALGEEDIGHFFPDTDAKFAGIRSTELLKEMKEILEKHRAVVLNIDSIIVAEEPR